MSEAPSRPWRVEGSVLMHEQIRMNENMSPGP
jgi:hypothetical protein